MTCGSNDDLRSELRRRAASELIAAALRAGRGIRLRVWGTSMLPAIRPGDVMLVSPSGEAPPARGEVVLCLRNGRLFAHRVVGGGGDQLITRGDTLPDCDPPVSPSELLGVVTGIVRRPATGLQPVIAVGPPSFAQTVIAFAIRRSEVAYRIVLKWNSLSRGHTPSLLGKGPGVRS